MKTLTLIALFLLAPTLHARDMYKCVDVNGNIMLTDEPCATLKPKPAQTAPTPKPVPQEQSVTKPLPPILPPAEQQIPPAPVPAPAAKPAY
jgi:hypothetical protein